MVKLVKPPGMQFSLLISYKPLIAIYRERAAHLMTWTSLASIVMMITVALNSLLMQVNVFCGGNITSVIGHLVAASIDEKLRSLGSHQ